jgi:hypothetical protein
MFSRHAEWPKVADAVIKALLCHLAEFARRDHVSSHIGIRILQRGLLDSHRRTASHRRAHKERGQDKCIEQSQEYHRLSSSHRLAIL